jgi:hypothetical protein
MNTIATEEYKCPKCGVVEGKVCRTPKGRKAIEPHTERIGQLSKKDVARCTMEYKEPEFFKQLEKQARQLLGADE